MTDNGIKVLNYLKKKYPNEVTKEQIMADTGLSSGVVQAALTGFGSLKRMGLINDRSEVIELEPAVEATETSRGRKAKIKTIAYYALNEEGLTFEG